MGFLDLLSGKKKKSEDGNNIPPPAPGANPPGQGNPKDAPKPSNVPPAPSADSNQGKQEEKKEVGDNKDGQQPPAPNVGDQGAPNPEQQKEGGQPGPEQPPKPAPAFKDDFPKLDLPKFPGGSDQSNMKVPDFPGKKPSTEGSEQEQPQEPQGQDAKAPGFPTPSEDKGAMPSFKPPQGEESHGGNPQQQPGAQSGQIKPPGAPDLKTTPQGADQGMQQNGFQQPPAPKPEQAPAQANMGTAENSEQEESFSKWHPQKYVTEDEQSLDRMKRRLHKPMDEVGTDKSEIGNVEAQMKKHRKVKGPLFIEINDYKRVLNSVDEIKRDVNESHDFVLKLDEFNNGKHAEFEKWKKCFEYIHNKLGFIDKTLFEETNN